MGRGSWTRESAGVALGVFMLVGQQVATQGTYEPADIEYGISVYRSQCATCHGENGDAIPNVDLRSGQFRRAVNDRELRAVITGGLPGTGMPPNDLDPAELIGIVAYLRNMNYEADAIALGDAARGRALFEGKGDCLRCHRVRGEGPRTAPELTAIGTTRPPSELRQVLVDPSGSMWPINRPVRIVTNSGMRITGRRLNEDTYTVQLIDDQERLWSLDKSDLREFTVIMESPMPSYAESLSEQELADLLAYLVSLKG